MRSSLLVILLRPQTIFQSVLPLAATSLTETTLISTMRCLQCMINIIFFFICQQFHFSLAIYLYPVLDVVRVVAAVYELTDVVDEGENLYHFNFEIMDQWFVLILTFKYSYFVSVNINYRHNFLQWELIQQLLQGTLAFWASISYAKILDKDDVVVVLLFVKMIRTCGQCFSRYIILLRYFFFPDLLSG